MEKPRSDRYEAIENLTPDQENTANTILAGSGLESAGLIGGDDRDWADSYNIREVNHTNTPAPGLIDEKSFKEMHVKADTILRSTPEENAHMIKTTDGRNIKSLTDLDVDLSSAKVEETAQDNFLKRVGKIFGM